MTAGAERPTEHNGHERRVLVVDDHDSMRRALTELIETRARLDVCAAATAEEAVRLLDDAPPDLVVADLDLPGMDGIELTRILHVRRPELPVLVLSSHSAERFEQPALAAGARAYLVKREAATFLIPAILHHLDVPEAGDGSPSPGQGHPA